MDKMISVIMPAHNARRYIADAIDSVMAQSYQNWELIVVDDASTDDTAEEIAAFCAKDARIRCIRFETNVGVSAARNAAVLEAKGEYVAFLDSDDLWHPEKLRMQMEQIGNADMSYTAYTVVNAEGRMLYDYTVPLRLTVEMLLKENSVGCSTVLIKRSIVASIPFRTDVAHEDYLLWLQLLQSGCRAVGCRESLTYWRFSNGSRSYEKLRSAWGRYRIYRILGLPFWKRIRCFFGYCVRGFAKYYRVLRGGRKCGG